MNDEALEKLSTGLEVLTKLSEINLSFHDCLQVGDAGVEKVVSQLLTMNSLNSITFYVSSGRPIKDEHETRLQMHKNAKMRRFH